MNMDGSTQEMVLKVGEDTATGTYSVNAAGTVTFTVTAATGSLAAAVPVGSVFTNS